MSYESASAPARPAGIHIAISLLALTFAVFLIAQIVSAGQQKDLMNFQIKTGDTQLKTYKDNETQLDAMIKQQQTLVDQSMKIQEQYQKMLDDLLKLSDEDEDAKAVVEKWKIQRAAGTGAAGSGATAPAGGAAAPASSPAAKKP